MRNPQFDLSVPIAWINSAVEELREHGLTDDEINALVAYLNTLN